MKMGSVDNIPLIELSGFSEVEIYIYNANYVV
jgi:hypothetical protein